MAALLAPVEALAALLQKDLDEAAARQALEAASGAVRGHCGWYLSRQVVTEYAPKCEHYRRTLWLPSLYVVSVEEVKQDDVVLVDGTDFGWTDYGKIYRYALGFFAGEVLISYTHGYESTDPKMDLVRGVVLSAAARRYENPLGHVGEVTGREQWTGSAAASAGLTDEERKDLGPVVLEGIG